MWGKTRLPGYLAVLCMTLALTGCGGKNAAIEEESPKEAVKAQAGILENTETAGTEEETDSGTAGPGAGLGEEKEEDQGRKRRFEAFAETIQEAVADRDLEALADLLAYPCTLETADQESIILEKREDLLKQNPDLVFGDDLMVAVANVDTAALEITEAGAVLGEGTPNITFGESPEGSLGITGINE